MLKTAFRGSSKRRGRPSRMSATLKKHSAGRVSAIEDEPNPVIEFTGIAEPEIEPVHMGGAKAFLGHDTQQERRVKAYRGMDAPYGLASMLAREDPNIGFRVFLLDNSGSTSESDGHVIERNGRGQLQAVAASRWEEICAMALEQAEWNARAGVRSEFWLLNPPCPESPAELRDYAVVDAKAGSPEAQVAALAQLLQRNGPRGTTPLAQRLQQLHRYVNDKVTSGTRIMLTIVTDGLPTSPSSGTCTDRDRHCFVQELRAFTSAFNSFVVIRLATDDDSAVEYYNKIDEELELPLDILDDLQGEAQELYDCGNGWFAYTPMVHRIREGGTLEKLFDLLDERALKTAEIAKFAEFLLRGPEDAAFPREPRGLFRAIEQAAARAPLVFNGRLGRMTPPVDLKLLKKALGLSTLQRMQALPTRMMRVLVCSKHLPKD